MNAPNDLFRPEVLDQATTRAEGEVLLVHPFRHSLMAALAFILLCMLGAFLACGSYTRHETVPGVLEPAQGVIKLYAPQAGVLRLANVHEGQAVHKGQVLLVFATEHEGRTGTTMEAELDAMMSQRVDLLHRELHDTLELQNADVAGVRQELANLRDTRKTQAKQLTMLRERVNSAEEILHRYQRLGESGFLPEIQVQQKRDELLDQQVRLVELQKEITSTDTAIANAERNLTSAPLRYAVTQAQLTRNVETARSDLSKQQYDHEWSLVAPCDGIVGSLTIAANQSASPGTPLIGLIPGASQLHAKLFAPSRALGFIRPGQTVHLKIDAFPYQKFGMVDGHVVSVSASPVVASELASATHLVPVQNNGEPLFALDVALEQQQVLAYGQMAALRVGMQADADVELDKRRLYEWILEPINSLH